MHLTCPEEEAHGALAMAMALAFGETRNRKDDDGEDGGLEASAVCGPRLLGLHHRHCRPPFGPTGFEGQSHLALWEKRVARSFLVHLLSAEQLSAMVTARPRR